jgi:hypothetical protein
LSRQIRANSHPKASIVVSATKGSQAKEWEAKKEFRQNAAMILLPPILLPASLMAQTTIQAHPNQTIPIAARFVGCDLANAGSRSRYPRQKAHSERFY